MLVPGSVFAICNGSRLHVCRPGSGRTNDKVQDCPIHVDASPLPAPDHHGRRRETPTYLGGRPPAFSSPPTSKLIFAWGMVSIPSMLRLCLTDHRYLATQRGNMSQCSGRRLITGVINGILPVRGAVFGAGHFSFLQISWMSGTPIMSYLVTKCMYVNNYVSSMVMFHNAHPRR